MDKKLKKEPEIVIAIEAKFRGSYDTAKGGQVEMEIKAVINKTSLHGKASFNFASPGDGAKSFFKGGASQMKGMIKSLAGF